MILYNNQKVTLKDYVDPEEVIEYQEDDIEIPQYGKIYTVQEQYGSTVLLNEFEETFNTKAFAIIQ